MKMLISPVDGREFDVESMTPRQRQDLHYTVEVQVAELVQSYPAFSEERKRLLREGYAFVHTLMNYKKKDKVSFGASNASVQLVCSIIKK